jgi:hypothetical protein
MRWRWELNQFIIAESSVDSSRIQVEIWGVSMEELLPSAYLNLGAQGVSQPIFLDDFADDSTDVVA